MIRNSGIPALRIICIAATMLSLQACPIGISYPLSEEGSETLDPRLIGEWRNKASDADNGAIMAFEIRRKDDYSCEIEILEKGSLYSLDGTIFRGWTTTVGGRTFMVAEDKGTREYYHYLITVDDNTLVAKDMTLLEGGLDSISSTADLQAEVLKSLEHAEFDDVEETRYTRR